MKSDWCVYDSWINDRQRGVDALERHRALPELGLANLGVDEHRFALGSEKLQRRS